MTPHVLRQEDDRRKVRGKSVVRLGSGHYFLLAGILGGMMGLVLLVFLIQLQQK